MWPLSGMFRGGAPKERVEPSFSNSLENPNVSMTQLAMMVSGADTYAGAAVSARSAMRITTVYRCVSIKAGVAAGMSLMVHRHTDAGRELARDHRLYSLLHDAPNDLMSAFNWKECIVADLDMGGNHYSVIEYDGAARVVSLLALPYADVTPARENGRNVYYHQTPSGRVKYDQEDIIHIPGLGFDGLKGISAIEYAAREAIGLSASMEQHVGAMHKNGIKPSVVVEMGRVPSKEGLLRTKHEFNQLYSGASNAGRAVFVDPNTKIHPISMTLADAQTLENRRFQIADIARAFGVPLHILGETEKSTSWGSGIEQLTIGFMKFTMDAVLKRIEAELNRKLFSWPYYCEFNRQSFNAMDSKAQSEMFASGVQNAIYTPNEIRRWLNLPDAPGGDQLYIQGATVPLVSSGEAQIA